MKEYALLICPERSSTGHFLHFIRAPDMDEADKIAQEWIDAFAPRQLPAQTTEYEYQIIEATNKSGIKVYSTLLHEAR